MDTAREVRVTLSTDLIAFLRSEAARLEVPLEYLVVGLLIDTSEQHADAVLPSVSASSEQAA